MNYVAYYGINITNSYKHYSLNCKHLPSLPLSLSLFQPSLRHEAKPQQSLDIRGSIVLKGLALATRIAYLAKSCLAFHSYLQVR
jgi:hypothetical protein